MYDLDNGSPDIDKKEVYGISKKGSLKRDYIAQEIEKKLDIVAYENVKKAEENESRFKKKTIQDHIA